MGSNGTVAMLTIHAWGLFTFTYDTSQRSFPINFLNFTQWIP